MDTTCPYCKAQHPARDIPDGSIFPCASCAGLAVLDSGALRKPQTEREIMACDRFSRMQTAARLNAAIPK